MKPALVSLFLFFAFPLAFAQQVLDSNGNPIFPGREYYILPAIFGPSGGGVKLATTGNSKCPVTVLQDYSEVVNGISVKFTIPGVSTLEIYEGTPLEIEFTKKPKCVDSSKWIVFVDNEIAKACVGIGGPEDHPGQQTFPGTFSIKKYKFGYKLVFCVAGSPTCLDIGRFDNGEGGRRLNLTEGEAFDIVFVESSSYNNIPELARTHSPLMTFKSVELSPASWMAVSWYPIYTIRSRKNDKDLEACFLTYHTLSSSFQDCETESDNIDTERDIYWCCGWGSTEGNKCKNKNGSSGGGGISLPLFGLATYKMQEDLWLNPEPCEYERISYLYSAADSWLKQLNVYHRDFNFFTQHPTATTL